MVSDGEIYATVSRRANPEAYDKIILQIKTELTDMDHKKMHDVILAGNDLQAICHDASNAAGWWNDPNGGDLRDNPLCFAAKLTLIHTEISEATEGDRKGAMDSHLPHRQMREVELADAVIRIFDLAGAYDMDLGGAIAEKLMYNANRDDHKPENRAKAGGKAY